jgi:predicted Rossmann-fold nucleotide-binding protein
MNTTTHTPQSATSESVSTLPTISTHIYPKGALDVLSREEVARLRDASAGGLHDLLRRCALAVLTSGSASDDPRAAAELYPDFDIEVRQQDRGVRIELKSAPAMAFVDGQIIAGVAELLFAVVRDLAFTAIDLNGDTELTTTNGITDAVFRLLRNARVLHPSDPNLVVCWGGHSIGQDEYKYTKQVGYELGLRGLDICTGCGPGAMKGPMKGATIAHAKQRRRRTRYIGITEPGIIAAESPNPIVNHLVIMPDIEKRLEAFVRMGHGIIVFPGGVGTAEEILYLLGILLREENAHLCFPFILTGRIGHQVVQHHRGRSCQGRKSDGHRHPQGEGATHRTARFVLLQLGAACAAGVATTFRAHARADGRARPAPRAQILRVGCRFTSCVFRHCGRQCERRRSAPNRSTWAVRNSWRP